MEKGVKRTKGIIREYVEAAVIAIILALFIRTFVVQAFKIPSGSMEPTLMVGDHILVNKFIYGVKIPYIDKTLIPISRPKRGDIVVFKFPIDKKKDFIKRVMGLPGETIEIVGKKIIVNGKPIEDRYGYYDNNPNKLTRRRFGPFKIPADKYFVMGDNRDHSYDSRYWGYVPFNYIKGKAFFIYWSWPHWKRSLHPIS